MQRQPKRIVRHCRELEPALASAQVLEVRVGLRPGRTAVRLEREHRGVGVVIHNYGHGGAGFTLAWGCADEVLHLARAT
jgi:FAD dependent oxidoreductase.